MERLWALLLVSLVGLAATTNYTNHAPLLPLLMQDLAFGPTPAGLLSSAFFLSGAAFVVPLGALVDRVGPRPVALLGLFGTALCTLGMAGARGYGDLFVLKLLAGVAALAAFVAGVRYAAVLFRGGLAHVAQGVYGGAVQLGGGGIIYALPLVAEPQGWRAAYLAAALFLAGVTALWLLAPAVPPPAASGRLRAALRQPAGWLLGLVHTAAFGLAVIVGTWAPTYLVREFGLDLATAGALGSTVVLLGVISRPFGGAVIGARWLTTRRVMQVAVVLNALGLAILAVPGRPLALAIAGLLVLGFGASLPYSAVFNTAAAALPGNPGAAIGIVTLVSLVGIVGGAPLVGGLLERSGGFTLPFGLLALGCVLVLGVFRWVRGQEELEHRPASDAPAGAVPSPPRG
jgi:nitrate/nitrite transporter NarK